MKNFCGECGFRLDHEFKFCPNCGNELEGGSNSDKTSTTSKSEKFIVCENCGEDNLATSGNCSSCGVKLKGSIVEKGITKTESLKKQNKTKQQTKGKKVAKESVQNQNEKTLDGKKILFVSSIVIIALVFLLFRKELFDSSVNQNEQQVNNQSSGTGIDLSNLNEITELENTVKANPNDKSSIVQLANLLQDSGLYDRAIIYYKKYLELDPTDSNARVDMGICFYNVNDFQSAIAEMEAALKYQPKHQLAHLNLGIVNLTAGNIDVSKEWFRKAFEIDPNSQAGKRAQELLQSH